MTDLATIPGLTVTPTGLLFDDDIDLDLDAWADYGTQLAGAATGLMWAVGDWILYGEGHYQANEVNAIAAAVGIATKTVINATSICKRVESERRRPELSFSHHEAVAAKAPIEQTAWLQFAIDEGLSVRELRERIANEKPPRDDDPDVGKPQRTPVRLRVVCPRAVPQPIVDEGTNLALETLKDFLAERGYPDADVFEDLNR